MIFPSHLSILLLIAGLGITHTPTYYMRLIHSGPVTFTLPLRSRLLLGSASPTCSSAWTEIAVLTPIQCIAACPRQSAKLVSLHIYTLASSSVSSSRMRRSHRNMLASWPRRSMVGQTPRLIRRQCFPDDNDRAQLPSAAAVAADRHTVPGSAAAAVPSIEPAEVNNDDVGLLQETRVVETAEAGSVLYLDTPSEFKPA